MLMKAQEYLQNEWMYIMSVKYISDNKTESIWNPDISA